MNVSRLPLVAALGALIGCASAPPTVPVASRVDLDRFMGDWYVIANIPTAIETSAYNAVESYAREDDGRIATTFRFNDGSFDGPLKTYTPVGFVRDDPSNAVWGMRFIWPIKAEYVISWLDDDYSETIIARSKLDYVWIMARTPQISDERYEALVARAGQMGYDTSKIRRVPQQSANERAAR
ncbi:MAG: lipocalin family protein [Pseudomonadota bacterium]